jgi:hypothetical protein
MSRLTGKDAFEMFEAYQAVYAPQQIDEAVKGADPEMRKAASAERKTGEKRLPPSTGKGYANQQKQSIAFHDKRSKGRHIPGMTYSEEVDVFDIVLEFLQVEGFAETLEEAEWMMANVIDEEAIEIILGEEQLDEISQKTATKAYAQSATGEFEGADSERDINRTNNLRRHIERKFGKKAAQNADKHADATTFGRKDPRTGKRQPSPKPRIEKNRTYRTTKAGKMHGQDQAKLKRDLKYNRFVED